MFENSTATYTPENFFAGDFPVLRDSGEIKEGAKINRYAPVIQGNDGIEEATAATLDKLIGIAADEANGDKIVYYLTGEFFAQALALPAGVTLQALKSAFRKLGIFLKEGEKNA